MCKMCGKEKKTPEKDDNNLELFFATTGAIGANISGLRKEIKKELASYKWKDNSISVRVIRIVDEMHAFLEENNCENLVDQLEKMKDSDRYTYTLINQDLGDLLRYALGGDILAKLAIQKIHEKRHEKSENNMEECVVYLIHSIKHPDEVELLRHVYQENFYLFGGFMPGEDRRKHLEEMLIKYNDESNVCSKIEVLIKKDYQRKSWDHPFENIDDKKEKNFLRNSSEKFWRVHLTKLVKLLKNFINTDNNEPMREFLDNLDRKDKDKSQNNDVEQKKFEKLSQDVEHVVPICDFITQCYPNGKSAKKNLDQEQLKRFLDIIFGDFHRSPKNDENGMYLAYSAMYRSADLGRQVGAVITNDHGDILALGYNEVPCFGALCSEDNFPENRDQNRGTLTHSLKRDEIADDIFAKLRKLVMLVMRNKENDSELKKKKFREIIKDSEVDKSLEYMRSVHAETSALLNAVNNGVSIKYGTMYVTTLPCHLCASHIIASGIKRVVYLEPYEKSLFKDFFANSIILNPDNENSHNKFNLESKVIFQHFTGVLPTSYRRCFDYPQKQEKEDEDTGGPKIWEPSDSKPERRLYKKHWKEKFYINYECAMSYSRKLCMS